MTDFEESLGAELAQLRREGRWQPLTVLESPQGSEVEIGGQRFINLCSNNYLGLNTHPHLIEAAIAATKQWGAGSGAVRTIAGTQLLHEELERKLAEFKGTPAALTLPSGFTANLAVLGSVLGEADAVVSDELNHASIIDGIRLTKARRYLFSHKDMTRLEERLVEARRDGARRVLVVTDGVFSMDGDIAPLPEIVGLAEAHGAAVMVDDAHGSGVLGRNGRGSVSHFQLEGRVQIQVGTLSKAVGVLGGYVAGSQELRDTLIHSGRPFLFSTSQPPAVVAACIAALEVMEQEPQLQVRLWENARHFKAGLEELGFDCGASETPITPVIVGAAERAVSLSQELRRRGVFATAIGFPTVAQDRGRVRTIVTSAHTEEQLDRALAAFAEAGRILGIEPRRRAGASAGGA
ncbi:MAG TPA: glycine C-acetyltransferase [Candidatus Dormibacteraeota bacterium]|nr:glycine C-acetyltransferase [Candidatus Dormibacteraeota bacterium]